jgi:type I restriction enzyme S subunit
MQDIGIVRRDALDRRVAMPEGDTSTYKVVRPGDFVISLRSFEGGLEYSDITGLVSPAYTVLRARTALEGTYYRHFFKSRSFVGRLDKLIFGIRDGKQIAFRDFGDMQIPAPPLEDQRNNAESLNLLEQDTALTTKHIDLLTRQKRGLMQKLLTGEWRVNPHG